MDISGYAWLVRVEGESNFINFFSVDLNGKENI